MLLMLEVGRTIDPVTRTDLDAVFTEAAFGEFLRLGESSGEAWIEARRCYFESEEFRIKWCNSHWAEVRATRESLSPREVHAAFAGHLLGEEWHSRFDWVPWRLSIAENHLTTFAAAVAGDRVSMTPTRIEGALALR